jgi:hypothetical protein
VTQFYRIQPDQDKYLHFELDGFDFLDKLGEQFELSDFGKPMQDAWVPIKGKFIVKAQSAREIPDISTWQTDLLILNQKAYDRLKDLLQSCGELLPVEVESDTFYLFNMLERLPDSIIDMNNSEYEYYEEEPVGFRILNFDANSVPQDKLLFGVQSDFAYNLYCDDRFIDLLDEKELGGLYFNTTLIDPYFK